MRHSWESEAAFGLSVQVPGPSIRVPVFHTASCASARRSVRNGAFFTGSARESRSGRAPARPAGARRRYTCPTPAAMTDPKTSLPPPTASAPAPALELGLPGFSFQDLHRPERLADLHAAFLAEVGRSDPELAARWQAWAEGRETLAAPAESQLLIELAREQSHFLARLFKLD